jgi:hypothetical protein
MLENAGQAASDALSMEDAADVPGEFGADEPDEEIIILDGANNPTDEYGGWYGTDIAPVGPVDCGVCGGKAELTGYGRLIAGACVVSGSCEISWSDMHPEA